MEIGLSSACSVPGKRKTLAYQTAYRKHHSTETTVLKIVSDALLAADRGEVTLLRLLDLSAAFDTVDHTILINRLRTAFGIRGSVLSWINSFISVRTQTVIFNGTESTRSVLDCGVPQGSVLGPVLLLLYTADVTNIVSVMVSMHIRMQTTRSFIIALKLCHALHQYLV